MFQTHKFSPALLLVWLFLSTSGMSQSDPANQLPQIEGPTVTVTAHRGETPYDQVGSSVTVLTAADLERSGVVYVADALRNVAGLDLVQTGGPGLTTSVFVRGAESGHTLFILDGVEMGDAIAISSGYDLGHLTVDNIDRIEIVRGPQSTLYGSDALGGVVQIFTKKGKEGLEAQLNLEGGSYGTQRQQLSAQGGTEAIRYSVSGSHFENDGFSTANERLGNGEDDGYRNNTLSARLDVEPDEQWDFQLGARLTDAKGDLDNGGGAGQDDPNYRSDHRETFINGKAGLALFDGAWQQSFGVAVTDVKRELFNDFDAANPQNFSDNSFNGDKVKFQWENQLDLGQHQLTFGAETENEKGSSITISESAFGPFNSEFPEEKARTTGFYLQDHIVVPGGLAITLGGRFDDHDRFGSEGTYRVAMAYNISKTGTTLRGSYGTGFKAPSLFQLFSSFGNRDLNPEESTGYDLGIDQVLANEKVRLGATYFRNDFEELITFSNQTFAYDNIAKANTSGLETRAAFKPMAKMWVGVDYTYLKTEDESTGLRLYRRAKNKANLQLSYLFSKDNQVQANVRHVGERDFQDFATFPATRVTLDSFTIFNLAGQFRVGRHLALSARIENLFDEEYEEVFGYGTPGLSGYLGLGLNL